MLSSNTRAKITFERSFLCKICWIFRKKYFQKHQIKFKMRNHRKTGQKVPKMAKIIFFSKFFFVKLRYLLKDATKPLMFIHQNFCFFLLYNFLEHCYTLKNNPVKLQKRCNFKLKNFVLNEKMNLLGYCRFEKYIKFPIKWHIPRFFLAEKRETPEVSKLNFNFFWLKIRLFGILSTSTNFT